MAFYLGQNIAAGGGNRITPVANVGGAGSLPGARTTAAGGGEGGGGEGGGGGGDYGKPWEGCRKAMSAGSCEESETQVINGSGVWCCPPREGQQCQSDAECGQGFKCVGGVCQQSDAPTDGGACPEGKIAGQEMNGCSCGKYYTTYTGACVSGYHFQPRGGTGWEGYQPPKNGKKALGRCECLLWCQKLGCDANCKNCKNSGGTLGEWDWPPEMKKFMEALLGRGNELLNRTPGYSDEAIARMFGQDFEKVRGEQRATNEQVAEAFARNGMLGTGALTDAMKDNAWNTEGKVGDIQRDLFIKNEEKVKADLLDFTKMANELLGSGTEFYKIIEILNSARRQEGNNALMLLLQLLNSQK